MKKLFTILMIAITSLSFAKENTTIKKTYSINNITEFDFETANIPVKVITTNGENIILTTISDEKLEIKENKDGSELKVEVSPALPFYKHIFNISFSFDNTTIVLEIPRKYNKKLNIKTKNATINASNLNVTFEGETKNGEINITNITGNVELETTNGELIVDNVKGMVNLETTNGSINVTNADSIYKLKSKNGEINARGNELLKDGSIKTTNGNIKLKINHLRGNNEISSTNGKVSLLTNKGEFTISKFYKNEVEDTNKDIVIKTTNDDVSVDYNKVN